MITQKLWHYFSLYIVVVLTVCPLKGMLKKLKSRKRLVHIVIKLEEYDIKVIPNSFTKAQALVHFIEKLRNSLEVAENKNIKEMCNMEIKEAQLW